MTTNAKIGHGATFEMNTGSGFSTIGEVTNITPPALSKDAIDATHTESPQKYREFISGLRDAGEVSIELNFVPGSASDILIRQAYELDTAVACRITLPAVLSSPTEMLTFDAIVTGYEPEAPVEDKMTATLTLKVSGRPVYSS